MIRYVFKHLIYHMNSPSYLSSHYSNYKSTKFTNQAGDKFSWNPTAPE